MHEVMNPPRVLGSLSCLLDYPRQSYRQRAAAAGDELRGRYPEAAQAVDTFLSRISELSDGALEELYTRTFDVAPMCVPYVTSYIYGAESFERGNLMSQLSDIYRKRGFDAAGELPDHIGVLLRFSALLDCEELHDLASYCLTRPLGEMIVCLEGSDNPFVLVLKSIRSVIETDLPGRSSND